MNVMMMMMMTTCGARVFQVFVLGACATVAAARCLTAEQVKVRADRFQGRHRLRALNKHIQLGPETQRGLTCEQLVEYAQRQSQQLHSRALSPWTYSLNRDERRFPRDISEARCLCHGCILPQAPEVPPHEDHSYNSVPVYIHVLVLTKARCAREPHKSRLLKKLLRVPVACTCAIPKYATDPGPRYHLDPDYRDSGPYNTG